MPGRELSTEELMRVTGGNMANNIDQLNWYYTKHMTTSIQRLDGSTYACHVEKIGYYYVNRYYTAVYIECTSMPSLNGWYKEDTLRIRESDKKEASQITEVEFKD